MKKSPCRAVLIGSTVLAISTSACDPGSSNTATPGLAEAEPTKTETYQSMTLDEQVEFSSVDLAERLGIGTDEITLSDARAVQWRSGALGCPEPGMGYTQALVPGALILLRAGKDIHRYHAKSGGKPFYCPQQRAEPPAHGSDPD